MEEQVEADGGTFALSRYVRIVDAVRRNAVAAWLRDVVPCRDVHALDDLAGATTATVHAVLALPADGGVDPVVVKVYDLGIDGVGADDVDCDAAALVAAAEVGIAAPRLIDADRGGARLGHPALVMTRLHGVPLAHGGDRAEQWVDGLAEHLVAIASAPLPSVAVGRFESWWQPPLAPPGWSDQPGLWPAVDEVLGAPLPRSAPDTLVHRDYHPLNVLWHEGSVTGTVDWVNGCLGPIESDIASCRVNIAAAHPGAFGLELADRFLAQCQAGGLGWHPAWDIDVIAGIDRAESLMAAAALGASMTTRSVCQTLDAMVARALDALG